MGARKERIVCFDSDGCVMDSMTVKHQRCFGPCLVAEWGLESRREEMLAYWDTVNLYSHTRGVNRFGGLLLALEHAFPGEAQALAPLKRWVNSGEALSEKSLERALEAGEAAVLEKALRWSRAVNRAVGELPPEAGKPFPGAARGLEEAAGQADLAVVSSANRQAVEEEWSRWGLLSHTGRLMTQETGSKAACIRRLAEEGYPPENILMVGDAPGDRDAALANGALFYPILVGREEQSWEGFVQTALPEFLRGDYPQSMENRLKQFDANLREGELTWLI